MCVYERNTDEENIRLIREENDNAAFEYLIKKYMGIVKKESRALYIIGAENEDIIQEGMIGLIKAIRSFDGSKGASFSTFANLCIKRQLITAVKLSNRKKHSPLNYYVSFYTENDDDVALVDELQADQAFEPENQMLGQLESQKLAETIDKKLSKFERQVLEGYLAGKSYDELAGAFGKTYKSIDNAIQRIRKKLRDIEQD